ncbi:MAG: aldo/keto reductase [Candidatus Marinimicrobia bacterium]|nr:aldo/keto reductase [Candidatus Neomarinimicrobiota bacterium]
MNHRKLGNSGFEVSEIGLGCWQLGGDWGDAKSKDAAYAILNAASQNGVTFFDTADVYGGGHSETLIGAFLKETGHSIHVATKFGRFGDVYPNGYTEAALRKAVDASRSRLQVESLDLLQLHCIPLQELRKGAVFDWLRKIKAEGLIRNFGASVESVAEGLICLEQDGLTSLQVIFNIFRQKLVNELLPQAKEKGVGIIVRLPLASGLLTGKFTQSTSFQNNDHRNYNKDGQAFNVGETFAGVPFDQGVDLAEKIKRDFLPAGLTMTQLALRWILNHEAVSTIIPGASSPEQAIANTKVSDIGPLSGELLDSLRKFYDNEVKDKIRGPY